MGGVLTEYLFHFSTGALSVVCAVLVFFIVRRRRAKRKNGGKIFELEELVTLDSRGWAVLALIAAIGAVITIGSSAGIGIAYWSGLAINADVTAGTINPAEATGLFGWLEFATVGVVSFFVLALIFELFSDLGIPIASGFKARSKKLIPELVVAATVGCIVMSLVTKWGYYDDKTHVREVEGARTTIDAGAWERKRDEAQATIDALASTPGAAVADAREAAANEQIAALRSQIASAEANRDALPETHSTNRIEAQKAINELSAELRGQQAELAAVVAIRDSLSRLDDARSDRDSAIEEIKALAENGDAQGNTRTRAGDLLFVRIFRVGVHQFLCWLFPIVYFESIAAYRDQKKKELANEKRRQTNDLKRNTYDADFEDVTPEAEFDTPALLPDGRPQSQETEEEELARLKREANQADDPRTARSPGYDRADENEEEIEGDGHESDARE